MLIEKDYHVLQIAVMLKKKLKLTLLRGKRVYLYVAVKHSDTYSGEENQSSCKMVLRAKSGMFNGEVIMNIVSLTEK